jgi:hypothetical protein
MQAVLSTKKKTPEREKPGVLCLSSPPESEGDGRVLTSVSREFCLESEILTEEVGDIATAAEQIVSAPRDKQSNRQTVKSCGVVSTFTQKTSSPLVKIPSVNVPPTSMSTVHTTSSPGLQIISS